MELIHLMSIAIELEPLAHLGAFPAGERRLVPFRSGTFSGDGGLRGAVAPGGVDWQTVLGDGTIEIRAHYLLTTDDGAPIEVTSEGVRVATPEVTTRLASGGPVDPGEYYFRTAVRLATSSSRWDRLNRILCVRRRRARSRRRHHPRPRGDVIVSEIVAPARAAGSVSGTHRRRKW